MGDTDLDPNDTYVGWEGWRFLLGEGATSLGLGVVWLWLMLLDWMLLCVRLQVNEKFLFFSLHVPAVRAG